ncbi:MFS transporter [Pseudarthrobacter sp. NIBRBAC000502770]|uniref:MFS transporter n=1 Tax=Pseudarthrobacter sp. NIBRBAC000502770 TaxID=2590785 RepID=UPI00352BBB81
MTPHITPPPTGTVPVQASPRQETPEAPEAPKRGRFSRLPQLAGAGFLPLGLFARLPLAMLAVGTLTLVTSASGSFAAGGTAAGAVGIGSALGAPVLGSLADRKGQRPVLLLAAVLNTVAVLALVFAAGSAAVLDGFAPPVLAAAFAAGATCPQVGPLARVRWMALTANAGGPTAPPNAAARDLDTALSYESTADEVTFVLGPALVGILASFVSPWLPLVLAAAMTITLVPVFAVHPTHRSVPARRGPAGGKHVPAAKLPAAVALPVLAMACMGTFFGSTQAALSAFSAGLAGPEIAGLLYAVMGLSSAAAALSVAYWPRRAGLGLRWVSCAVLMAGLAVLLLVPSSLPMMALVLLVLGLPVGPVMVTVFAVGGKVAPAGRLGTVMTALASGIVAGTAVGSSIGGQLAQLHGAAGAFLVPLCAAVALALLGAGTAVVLRRRT